MSVALVTAMPCFAKPPKPLDPPTISISTPKPPWRRRRRRGVTGMQARGHGLIDLSQWPPEPPSPKQVNTKRFARALREICGWMPKRRPLRYARWIIKHSNEFSVDPFTVAAFIYRQSLCVPRDESPDYGTGLARINERMHRPFVRHRQYHYWLLQDGAWQPRKLAMPRFLFHPSVLKRSETNIYFAAALLAMWSAQCPHIDGAFGSVPHRHPVSHMIWGDRVKNAGPEDRILRARRRLLRFYHDKSPPSCGHFRKVALYCPLDGQPRKLTSVMGEPRDEGRRTHKGVDFSSSWGEPVYAIAAGRVFFAGIDRRRGLGVSMPLEEAQRIDRSTLGPGGFNVMIRHANGLVSAYMHLASYTVERGQSVKAGELIGRVGHTGIKQSTAHLHFELRFAQKHIDPVPHLRSCVFLPSETYIGRNMAYERWRQKRRRRRRHR